MNKYPRLQMLREGQLSFYHVNIKKPEDAVKKKFLKHFKTFASNIHSPTLPSKVILKA